MAFSKKVMKSQESTPRSTGPANLFLAARLDDVEMFDEALQGGQPINDIHPLNGKTPLHVAASWGSENVIDRISEIPGVDPWIFDKSGCTAFDYSVMRKDTEIKAKISQMMDRANPELSPQ